MKKAKEPSVPLERRDTLRHEITAALRGRALSARDISAEVHIPEKEVYEHLEHIRKSMNKRDLSLQIEPAECMKCGFVFRKREKFRKPGRCPVCRGEQIQDPLFSIRLSGEDTAV